jgi:hypothetical protein
MAQQSIRLAWEYKKQAMRQLFPVQGTGDYIKEKNAAQQELLAMVARSDLLDGRMRPEHPLTV